MGWLRSSSFWQRRDRQMYYSASRYAVLTPFSLFASALLQLDCSPPAPRRIEKELGTEICPIPQYIDPALYVAPPESQ
jgi:hypothetical protein